MDDTQRIALEQEFEEKSARLTEMMEQVPDMQKAYQQLEAAVRARAVKDAENAAKDETVEMERMLARCQQAQSDLEAAMQSGNEARIALCKQRREDEHLAFDLAERRMQDGCRRYQAEIIRQGFGSEAAYQAAFLTKPALLKLEEKVNPFREEYAALLARCEEIEKLLSEEN